MEDIFILTGNQFRNWQEKLKRETDKRNWQEKLTRETDKRNWQKKLTRETDKRDWQEKPFGLGFYTKKIGRNCILLQKKILKSVLLKIKLKLCWKKIKKKYFFIFHFRHPQKIQHFPGVTVYTPSNILNQSHVVMMFQVSTIFLSIINFK